MMARFYPGPIQTLVSRAQALGKLSPAKKWSARSHFAAGEIPVALPGESRAPHQHNNFEECIYVSPATNYVSRQWASTG